MCGRREAMTEVMISNGSGLEYKRRNIPLFLSYFLFTSVLVLGFVIFSKVSKLILLNTDIFVFLSKVEYPMLFIFIGIFLTIIVQSSSICTMFILNMIRYYKIDLLSQYNLIIGANIGTSFTSTIVSSCIVLYKHFKDDLNTDAKNMFKVSIMHDLFNWFTAIFWLILNINRILINIDFMLYSISKWIYEHNKLTFFDFKLVDKVILYIINLTNYKITTFIILLIFSILFIIISFNCLKNLIKNDILDREMELCDTELCDPERCNPELNERIRLSRFDFLSEGSDLKFFCIGVFATILLQSSSMVTSLLLIFVYFKQINFKNSYSITVGSNLGTTFSTFITALLINNVTTIKIALFHVIFNLVGIMINFIIKFPLLLIETM